MMSGKEERIIEVTNLSEYISTVSKNFSNIKPNSFFEKEKVFFRGQSNDEFKLIPSLARRVKRDAEISYLSFEGDMIKTAKLQNPEEFSGISYPLNMLAKMQHY